MKRFFLFLLFVSIVTFVITYLIFNDLGLETVAYVFFNLEFLILPVAMALYGVWVWREKYHQK